MNKPRKPDWRVATPSQLDPERWVNIGAKTYSEGDFLSLDGNTGNVYAGALDVIVERPKKYLAEVDRWKDEGRGKQMPITAFGS